MKKLKSTKKYSFFVIVTILIISMVGMIVYGNTDEYPFKINTDYTPSELNNGDTANITYNVIPNPIKFKDNVEKDVVLILDTSQTVNREKSYEQISVAAQNFVTGLLKGYKNLKIGIVSYNEKAEILHVFDNSTYSINHDIKKCYENYNIDSGNHLGTNVGDAFRLAISMLGKDVDANKEKIVIFMSNGKPNAYTGKFYKGPESIISDKKFTGVYKSLYEITSLSGSEEGVGKESLKQEENTMDNKIKNYEKYFYNPESLDEYRKQDFQKRGLRFTNSDISKFNDLIYGEYGVRWANIYINKIYGNPYCVNVCPPNKQGGKNAICYYMGAEIGYAYSLKMAKEMKDLGISTYPIYFDNDGSYNNSQNKDYRENTMKLISKFAGNHEENDVTSVNTVYSNDITESLKKVFNDLDKNIKESYSVNDAKLTINIPEGLEVESINYSGKTIKINKEDIKDGKYQLPLNNLGYTYNPDKKEYEYKGKPLKISINIVGKNTSGKDKDCIITGEISSKSLDDGKVTEFPKVNIKVKSSVVVQIKVNDFIGNIGKEYNSENIKPQNNSFDLIENPNRLIGYGNANISVKGIKDNDNKEYWIKTWFTKEKSEEEINQEEFKLNNMNSDIIMDKPNNLTYQAYNVSHLEPKKNESKWNDRNEVFKSKQGDIGYLPSNTIAGLEGNEEQRILQYGEPLSIGKKYYYYYKGSSNYELKDTGEKKTINVLDEETGNFKRLECSVWRCNYEKSMFYHDDSGNWYENYSSWWAGTSYYKKVNYYIKVTNEWIWKHKTIFYNDMTIDDIKDYYDKYSDFSYKEADKYWGYIKPKESGWYLFGTYSDDGSRFSITKDGKTYELSKSNFGLSEDYNDRWYIGQERGNFKVHGSAVYSSFTPIYLDKDKYYPIQLEYFNWGGEGSFKLGYFKLDNYGEDIKNIFEQFNKATSTEDYESLSDIFNQEKLGSWYNPYYRYYINGSYINDCLNKLKWVGDKNGDGFTMYPSKSNEPGDVANEVFEGKSGVELPKENGVYTMHYKIFTRAKDGKIGDKIIKDNIIKGIYGKFEIKDLLNAGIDVTDINGDNKIYANNNAIVNYRINPNPLNVTDVIRDGKKPPNKIILSNLKINGLIPKGLTLSNNNSVDGNLESDGSTRIHTNGMKDIVYNLKGNQYVANSIDEKVDVIVKSVGNFVFKEDQNTVGFNLKYEDKETKPMLENFKGSSVSINEPTKIEKFGILDSASSDNIKDASEGVQVVNGIPLKIAILADVKSPNSIIDLGFNSQNIKVSNEENPQFKVKIYNKGNLISSEKEFTINKLEGNLIDGLNSGIKISGLDVGEKVIVVELIPNNIEINNSA
ncbi:VWA domain-containing protein [Clostridium perfringens]|uniref:von Willebrand factor type A domain protein n=1 Tax=Clostridium perfringens TaxID=1502 RepID=A0A133MNE1_CLOPF|nr:VWA domain-containing protein [Clostridium perfringens]KXA05559.1 von Willebrand factor type A domain protein [Clostridium perfringens]